MEEKTILIVIPLKEKHRELLKKIAGKAEIIFSDPERVAQEQVDQAEIILGNIPPEMVKKAKKLKWLQLNSAGFDAYAKADIMGNRILTSCSGAYGQAVSEHMFAMLLAMQKKLHFYRDDQKLHKWGDEGMVTSISDTTVMVLGLGDIGKHFPDTDPAYEGISSISLLKHVGRLLDENGYVIENIDATIIAQQPKMRPYIDRMCNNIASALNIETDQVNVKATTEEGLGFTGSGEGISSHAVCAIEKYTNYSSVDMTEMSSGCGGCCPHRETEG